MYNIKMHADNIQRGINRDYLDFCPRSYNLDWEYSVKLLPVPAYSQKWTLTKMFKSNDWKQLTPLCSD